MQDDLLSYTNQLCSDLYNQRLAGMISSQMLYRQQTTGPCKNSAKFLIFSFPSISDICWLQPNAGT